MWRAEGERVPAPLCVSRNLKSAEKHWLKIGKPERPTCLGENWAALQVMRNLDQRKSGETSPQSKLSKPSTSQLGRHRNAVDNLLWSDTVQVICWHRAQQLSRKFNSQAAEGKRDVNSSTPWTLSALGSTGLQSIYPHHDNVCTNSSSSFSHSSYACTIIYLRCELFRRRTTCFLTSQLLFHYQKT